MKTKQKFFQRFQNNQSVFYPKYWSEFCVTKENIYTKAFPFYAIQNSQY